MLEFVVESKSGVFQRVATPRSVHGELLLNAVSFAELVFDDDDRALESLGEPGTRVRVLYDGAQRMAGPVKRLWRDKGGNVTVQVHDDFHLLKNLGWPKPAAALTAQSDEYRRYSDDVETVVKTACAELSTRLGLGWSIPTTTGLGSNVRVELRFHPIADKLLPLLNADRLRWSIVGNVVNVTQGQLFPRVLTLDSGVIGDYEWSIDAPTVTRVVVGGSGEGTARTFRGYVDTDREADWGFISESFKDSRMADGITDLQPDADEVLAEGAPRVSFQAELNENAWFRFGTYLLGDRVHVNVGQVDVTDVISKITLDDTPGDGLTVVPTVGLIDNSADARLFRNVAALGRGVRDSEKR